jgi:hypothetical protein
METLLHGSQHRKDGKTPLRGGEKQARTGNLRRFRGLQINRNSKMPKYPKVTGTQGDSVF